MLPSAALVEGGSSALRLALQNWLAALPRDCWFWYGPEAARTRAFGQSEMPEAPSGATDAAQSAGVASELTKPSQQPCSEISRGTGDADSVVSLDESEGARWSTVVSCIATRTSSKFESHKAPCM